MTEPHHSEEARKRCWACSFPEKLEISEADVEHACKLIDEGYLSTSNKYMTVCKSSLPRFEEAISFHPSVPSTVRDMNRTSYESAVAWHMRVHPKQHTELTMTTGQFRAFKKLGGRSA